MIMGVFSTESACMCAGWGVEGRKNKDFFFL